MKILITNHHLRDRGGTELFTLNLAKELKKRGHSIFVYSPLLGSMSEQISSFGIKVVSDIRLIENEKIDVIHAQHNTTAILARSIFPETPMIFMSHGVLPELEQVPSVDIGISKFLAVSEEVANNLEVRGKIRKNKIEIIRNFVDTDTFFCKKKLNTKVKNLLVVSNHFTEKFKHIVEETSKIMELNIVHVGYPDNSVENVQDYINDADLVITLGRGAIEAMACERSVIVYDVHGADGLVDENNFFEIRKNNFSGRRYKINFSTHDLEKEILKFNPDLGRELRKIILEENSKSVIIDKLERVYFECIKEGSKESWIKKDQLFNELNFLEKSANYLDYYNSLLRLKDKDINNKDQEVIKLNDVIKLKDYEINDKNNFLVESKSLLDLKNQELKIKDQEILTKNNELEIKTREILAMKSSKFWKLRNIYKKLRKISFKKSVYLVKKVFFILKRDGFINFLGRVKGFLERSIYGSVLSIKEIVDSRGSFKKNEETNGLVSVVIPIYDRTWELKESIESILNQSYSNFELILVTDGSPQETISVVEEYRNNPKVKIFHYYNNTGNAVRGRNKGIKEACGEYVAFQDSDDVAEKDRLEKSIMAMKRNKADVVYGGWRAKLDGTRKDTDLVDGQEVISPDCDTSMLRSVCVPCQSTVMVSKKALSDVGGLKAVMKYREDHELWLRLSYFGYRFKAIPEILTNLRLHKGNNELKFKKEDEVWKKLMLSEYKKKNLPIKKMAYFIPVTSISGGIAVILNHANLLLKRGYDVFLISQDDKTSIDWFPNQRVPIIALKDIASIQTGYYFDNIDILIATHWTTFDNVMNINSKRKIYFVQSDERNFDDDPEYKKAVQKTYEYGDKKVEYMTMANWIRSWLKIEFGHNTHYVPNGLDLDLFHPVTPIKPKSKRVRVLLEGPIDVPFKGMADAFEVVRDLDCEVWAISSSGKPLPSWRCDRFFEKVNHDNMPEIYSSCDVLLKMSNIESFSYPPLEMMACGGVPVIKEVSGIEEYAINGVNCFVIKNIKEAKVAISNLISDRNLYNKIKESGLETVKKFDWKNSIDILEGIINNKNKE